MQMLKEKIFFVAITYIFLLAMLAISYVWFFPKTIAGELFFGGYAPLYNIKLAKFSYEQSLRFDAVNGIPPPYAHYQLSRIAFIQGDLRTALNEIDIELEVYPAHMHANYVKGLTLAYMRRDQEAIDAFAKFIVYKPLSWAARNDKAWLHFRLGDIDEALDTIIPAVVPYPENPWVLNTYGVMLMNKGEYAEAQKQLSRGLLVVNQMTEKEWGESYPGNSPQIWERGLDVFRKSLAENLVLTNQHLSTQGGGH